MDAAMLIEALASPELLQSVLEHFPSDLIEAELALLSQAHQQRFIELSSLVTKNSRLAQQPPLQINDTVRYANPNKLQKYRKFEGIDLTILEIWHAGGDGSGDLAFCHLPDGSKETFGLRCLQRVEDATPEHGQSQRN